MSGQSPVTSRCGPEVSQCLRMLQGRVSRIAATELVQLLQPVEHEMRAATHVHLPDRWVAGCRLLAEAACVRRPCARCAREMSASRARGWHTVFRCTPAHTHQMPTVPGTIVRGLDTGYSAPECTPSVTTARHVGTRGDPMCDDRGARLSAPVHIPTPAPAYMHPDPSETVESSRRTVAQTGTGASTRTRT